MHSCVTQQLFTPARVGSWKYTRYNKLDHIVLLVKNQGRISRELFGTVEHSVIYNLFDNDYKTKCKQSLDVKINGDVVNIIIAVRQEWLQLNNTIN